MAATCTRNDTSLPTSPTMATPTTEKVKRCKRCEKEVFQMELVKAEKSFWHRNCFKCFECNKQLRMDTYQSHEGVLYCKPHFRALFAPKPVKETTSESSSTSKTRKYEVIIRENQPMELPPDVVRSSDKPNLGLEELQTLNLKSRYQFFEQRPSESQNAREDGSAPSRQAILSKIARLETKGVTTGVPDDALKGDAASQEGSDSSDDEGGHGNFTERLGYREMRDIRRKFEEGNLASREERREERKQEIQNIRSRLFQGKQAKIKEMYQQAVLESEQTVSSKSDIAGCKEAKSIRERFERGDAFVTSRQTSNEEDMNQLVEHGLAKASRSIFQELDTKQVTTPNTPPIRTNEGLHRSPSSVQYPPAGEIIRSDSKVDNVHVETKEISNRFKFFETYRPEEHKRREFRITPPRDGVVRMPSPEEPEYKQWPKASEMPQDQDDEDGFDDTVVAAKQHTAKKMLSLFRQMEMMQEDDQVDTKDLKPPKDFTPPPERTAGPHAKASNGRIRNGDSENGQEDPDNEDSEEKRFARASELKSKFENWEFKDLQRDSSSASIRLFDNAEESQIESAKSLSAKFESLKHTSSMHRPRQTVKVNRFV